MKIEGAGAISWSPDKSFQSSPATQGPPATGTPVAASGPGAPVAPVDPERALGRPVEKQSKAQDEAAVAQAAERLNKLAEAFSTQLRFSVHRATNEILVKVINSKTGEIIREIPPEKILDAVAQMQETLGLLFDAKV
ncbi:MAG: flagellar protein FlaG [Actinobacteria bacterium]|nr:flagellar protein FlaG [Actinomycetota bacterium]